MYAVTYWEDRKIYREFKSLGVAKRWCRGLGHTGEDNPGLTGYPPIAYVADIDGLCVYNPRFSKRVSESAGGLINAQPSSHF